MVQIFSHRTTKQDNRHFYSISLLKALVITIMHLIQQEYWSLLVRKTDKFPPSGIKFFLCCLCPFMSLGPLLTRFHNCIVSLIGQAWISFEFQYEAPYVDNTTMYGMVTFQQAHFGEAVDWGIWHPSWSQKVCCSQASMERTSIVISGAPMIKFLGLSPQIWNILDTEMAVWMCNPIPSLFLTILSLQPLFFVTSFAPMTKKVYFKPLCSESLKLLLPAWFPSHDDYPDMKPGIPIQVCLQKFVGSIAPYKAIHCFCAIICAPGPFQRLQLWVRW